MSRLAAALVRWQHAAGPWWPYVCAAPFLSTAESELLAAESSPRTTDPASRLGSMSNTPVERGLPDPGRPGGVPHRGRFGAPSRDLADWLAPSVAAGASAAPDPLVVLVDAPAEPILAVTPLLVARGWYVVPVVQRWIAKPAVLPCGRLLRLLLDGSWQVRRPTSPRGVLLIADGARTGKPGYPILAPGRAFDNRYEYQICRFPSLDFLRGQSVHAVHWITDQPGGVARPDLAPYLEDLLRVGLSVELRAWPERGERRGARGER
ncbi:MAG: hypothetical protein U0893_14725 [Chloroflexota bacterium]